MHYALSHDHVHSTRFKACEKGLRTLSHWIVIFELENNEENMPRSRCTHMNHTRDIKTLHYN